MNVFKIIELRSFRSPKKLIVLIICLIVLTIVINRLVFIKQYYSIKYDVTRRRFGRQVPEFDEYNVSFERHVIDFIGIANQLNVNAFLIDPKLIYQTISDEYKELLIRRQLLPEILANKETKERFCVSFGAFKSDIRQLRSLLSPFLKLKGYSETIIKGPDGSQRNINENNSKPNTTLLHMIYTKSGQCIQISVFYKRNEILWTGEIPPESRTNIPFDLYFGKHESAFDSFNLYEVKLKTENIRLLLPENRVHFLSELNSSKFIECNHKLAEDFRQKYNRSLVESENLNNKVKEGLIALKKFTSKIFMPFFICSGTLLGWYRQCSAIPYTSDLDTCTWAIYANQETTDAFMNNDVNLTIRFIFGLIDNGFQFAFYTVSDFRVDLFFTYKLNGKLSYSVHDPFDNAYNKYIYPDFTLCSAELLGIKVLIPCIPENVIRTEYGSTWDVPKKYGEFEFKNAGQKYHWNKEDSRKSYKFTQTTVSYKQVLYYKLINSILT